MFFHKVKKQQEPSPLIDNIEAEQTPEEQPRINIWHMSLLGSTEGCILLIGVSMAFIYACWLGIQSVANPEQAPDLIGMTAINIAFGRAASMTYGFSRNLGNFLVLFISMTVETILVLIVYPLFVFSLRRLLVFKGLKKYFDNLQNAAEQHKDLVHKYGIIGLFAFVWFPFWMTGPVVGCVIGFLMALPAWVTIPIVLAGTYAASLVWAFFLHKFQQQLASYSPYAAMVIICLVVLVIIVGHYLQQSRQDMKKKNKK